MISRLDEIRARWASKRHDATIMELVNDAFQDIPFLLDEVEQLQAEITLHRVEKDELCRERDALRTLVQRLQDCRKEYQKKFARVCTSPGDTHYVALSFAGDVMTLLAAYDRLPKEDAR